jgi:hypothetical protein
MSSFIVRGYIQNIPDWCRYVYSSCGGAKHRQMVGLPCLVSQLATLHVAGWTWAVFTRVYLESCISLSPQSGNFWIYPRTESPWSLVNHTKSNYKSLKIWASQCLLQCVFFWSVCLLHTTFSGTMKQSQLPTRISEIALNTNKTNSLFESTDYGLDGPGIESRWGRDFSYMSRPVQGPTHPPVQWVPGLSRG